MRARNVTICALKGRLTPRVVPSISFYPGIVRRRQYCTTFLKMRGRDASLVEPMSFGMSALAIGSAHCPHAPPGTDLVASTLVSIKVHTILGIHDILLMERINRFNIQWVRDQ